MKPTTASFEEMIQRAINSLKQADTNYSRWENEEHTKLCLAAARTWINRAEFSMRNNGNLDSEDNAEADQTMFQELLGDYTKKP